MMHLKAQTCSCGGAPLLGFLNSGVVEDGRWLVALRYEYNNLSDLVFGTQLIDDDSRTSISHSGFLSISHGVTTRLSVTGVITRINKLREVGDEINISGWGDVVLLAQLNLHPKYSYPKRELVVGFGIKAPIGPSDLKYNGLLISADMQPTSGAYDGLFTIYGSTEILMPKPLTLFGAFSYRNTGSSQRYKFSSDLYRFGSEGLVTLGLIYEPWLSTYFEIEATYLNRLPDRFADFEQPNTGGNWLYLGLAASSAFGNNWSVKLNGQKPVYQDLKGAAQFSTRLNLGLVLVFHFGANEQASVL